MKTCPHCGVQHDRSQRYCSACHARYMRGWRRSHPLKVEQRFKMNARSYAHVYRNRGKIECKPCENCGSEFSEMHHEDYSQPLQVNWLCRECHLQHHHLQADFSNAPRGTLLKAA